MPPTAATPATPGSARAPSGWSPTARAPQPLSIGRAGRPNIPNPPRSRWAGRSADGPDGGFGRPFGRHLRPSGQAGQAGDGPGVPDQETGDGRHVRRAVLVAEAENLDVH